MPSQKLPNLLIKPWILIWEKAKRCPLFNFLRSSLICTIVWAWLYHLVQIKNGYKLWTHIGCGTKDQSSDCFWLECLSSGSSWAQRLHFWSSWVTETYQHLPHPFFFPSPVSGDSYDAGEGAWTLIVILSCTVTSGHRLAFTASVFSTVNKNDISSL